MANESSAYGTVTIKGTSLDGCEKVLKNMRKFEHWAYPRKLTQGFSVTCIREELRPYEIL